MAIPQGRVPSMVRTNGRTDTSTWARICNTRGKHALVRLWAACAYACRSLDHGFLPIGQRKRFEAPPRRKQRFSKAPPGILSPGRRELVYFKVVWSVLDTFERKLRPVTKLQLANQLSCLLFEFWQGPPALAASSCLALPWPQGPSQREEKAMIET